MRQTIEYLLHRAKQEAKNAQDALEGGNSMLKVYAHREKAVAYHAKALLLQSSVRPRHV